MRPDSPPGLFPLCPGLPDGSHAAAGGNQPHDANRKGRTGAWAHAAFAIWLLSAEASAKADRPGDQPERRASWLSAASSHLPTSSPKGFQSGSGECYAGRHRLELDAGPNAQGEVALGAALTCRVQVFVGSYLPFVAHVSIAWMTSSFMQSFIHAAVGTVSGGATSKTIWTIL